MKTAKNGMTPAMLEQWNAFLNGHWTKEKPQRVGRFKTATSQGEPTASEIVVYRVSDGNGIVQYHLAQTWGGYFWSEPTPEMPLVPGSEVAKPVRKAPTKR